MACITCDDTGWVCENPPIRPWGGRHSCRCGAPRENKQLEVDASEIRFRAERRIGELMSAQRDGIGLAQGREQTWVQTRPKLSVLRWLRPALKTSILPTEPGNMRPFLRTNSRTFSQSGAKKDSTKRRSLSEQPTSPR